tara:strand:+ start:65 stop:283 length:219 start_codon:yes stop_codon:yes gene_type:complete
MVKFILVLQLCSSVTCYTPMTNPSLVFDSYRDCAISGYIEGGKMMEKFDPVEVELNKPIIRFWCQQEKKQNI